MESIMKHQYECSNRVERSIILFNEKNRGKALTRNILIIGAVVAILYHLIAINQALRRFDDLQTHQESKQTN